MCNTWSLVLLMERSENPRILFVFNANEQRSIQVPLYPKVVFRLHVLDLDVDHFFQVRKSLLEYSLVPILLLKIVQTSI